MTSVHCQDPHQAQLVFSAWADCQPVQMAQVWCDVPSDFGLLAMAEVSYCKYVNSIPYHPSRCSIVLPCTTLRPVQCWPIVHARQNGKEEKGVYPGVSDAWLPPLCWHCMRVVYVREDEGRLKNLVPIVQWARPVRWVSLSRALRIVWASAVIPKLACTRDPGFLKTRF